MYLLYRFQPAGSRLPSRQYRKNRASDYLDIPLVSSGPEGNSVVFYLLESAIFFAIPNQWRCYLVNNYYGVLYINTLKHSNLSINSCADFNFRYVGVSMCRHNCNPWSVGRIQSFVVSAASMSLEVIEDGSRSSAVNPFKRTSNASWLTTNS